MNVRGARFFFKFACDVPVALHQAIQCVVAIMCVLSITYILLISQSVYAVSQTFESIVTVRENKTDFA